MSSLDSTALSVDGAWSDPTVDEHAVDGEDAVPTGLRLRVQTDVRLALPKDQDTSIAIQIQDPPERHYRAIPYVNGWQWVTTCRIWGGNTALRSRMVSCIRRPSDKSTLARWLGFPPIDYTQRFEAMLNAAWGGFDHTSDIKPVGEVESTEILRPITYYMRLAENPEPGSDDGDDT
jgi:hypothetical protein